MTYYFNQGVTKYHHSITYLINGGHFAPLSLSLSNSSYIKVVSPISSIFL
jgi:hypothetical protein